MHSAKDVPGELGDGLALLASPPRAAAEDVLCGASGLDELPSGARVGTSSVRRIAQLAPFATISSRSRCTATSTRACASSQTASSTRSCSHAPGSLGSGASRALGAVLDTTRFVPAPGQGTLALEGRADDEPAREAAAAIGDADTLSCLLAERALARALGASCDTPLGALARVEGDAGLRCAPGSGCPTARRGSRIELSGEATIRRRWRSRSPRG